MMNVPYEERPPHDQRLLDRLADGELDARQRQRLLSALDQQPDGWRNCALTLLEAQCWRDEMTTLTRQAAAGPPPDGESGGRLAFKTGPIAATWADAESAQGDDNGSVVGAAGGDLLRCPAARRRPRAGRLVALAAGLLVAFSLGMIVRDIGSRPGPNGDRPGGDARRSLAGDPALRSADIVRRDGPPRAAQQDQVAVAQSSAGATDSTTDTTTEATGDAVTFLVPTGQGSATRPVRVPLVSAQGIAGVAPRWLTLHEPPLPDALVRQLEQTGHKVSWQRRYAPLQLEDGRQVVFPVDDLKIATVVFKPL